MAKRVLEGKWDCSNCLTKRIAGRHKACPSCNDPRNTQLSPSEKPYLPNDSDEVLSPELLSMANAGADWNCGKCGEANRGDRLECMYCNRPLSGDDDFAQVTAYTNYLPDGQGYGSREAAENRRIDDLLDELPETERELGLGEPNLPDVPPDMWLPLASAPADSVKNAPDPYYVTNSEVWILKNRKRIFAGGGISAAAAALLFSLMSLLATEPTVLSVGSLSWQRQVEVEELKTYRESGWSTPAGAYDISSGREIRRYDRVLDHYETKYRSVTETVSDGTETQYYDCNKRLIDKGNGFFEEVSDTCSRQVPRTRQITRQESYQEPVYRSEPVYDTKYYYAVDRWETDRWVLTADESSNAKPIRPFFANTLSLEAKERKGDELREEYTASLVDSNGKTHAYSLREDQWRQLSIGQEIPAEVTSRGRIRNPSWPWGENK